ncbi:MAG: protein phosphatase 2C domain-containing protein [Rhodobacteraceae bacterium]|nr:protein phosphatase 2C domain-containing protein [Paracoccaceae bacterium]
MRDAAVERSRSLTYETATFTTTGRRERQEDCLLASFPAGQAHGFAIVADGMGGAASGEVASALAVAEVFAHLKVNEAHLAAAGAGLPHVLRAAAEDANTRIGRHGALDPQCRGMGTTLLVAVLSGDRLFWISVGDSPLLLVRDGSLTRLNRDHSMAGQIDLLARSGQMDEAVAAAHPDRSVLTSALTGAPIPRIDCPEAPVTVLPGDVVIAATDGLLSVPRPVLARTLARAAGRSAEGIAHALREAIAGAADPHQDNASIAVIRVGVPPAASRARVADSLPVHTLVRAEAKRAPAEAPWSSLFQRRRRRSGQG